MILRSGYFHADPHPGNILVCKVSEIALLDYGQVKDLPDELRLGYASLVLAIADNDPIRASESFRRSAFAHCETDEVAKTIKVHKLEISTLAALSSLQVLCENDNPPAGCSVSIVNENLSVYLELQGNINVEAQLEKLKKKMEKIRKRVPSLL